MRAATESPFFIVGPPRSGSTLLATIMSRHSDVAIPPETHYLDKTFENHRRLPCDRRSIASILADNIRLQDLGMLIDAGLESVPEHDPGHAAVFGALLRAYAAARNKSRVGEKTPAHLPYVETLLEWFPGTRVICLVRDARDTVRSLLDVPWTHDNAWRHAAHWTWCARRMRVLRSRHPESIVLLRYEDLLGAPEDSLQRLCDFVGIGFEPSMFDLDQVASTIPEWERSWKSDATRGLNPERRFRWQNDIDNPLYRVVDTVARSELAAFDYPRMPRPISWRRRLSTMPRAIWYSRWNYALIYQKLARRLRRLRPRDGFRERQEHR